MRFIFYSSIFYNKFNFLKNLYFAIFSTHENRIGNLETQMKNVVRAQLQSEIYSRKVNFVIRNYDLCADDLEAYELRKHVIANLNIWFKDVVIDPLDCKDISHCHRDKSNVSPKPIIVRFNDMIKFSQIMRNLNQMKEVNKERKSDNKKGISIHVQLPNEWQSESQKLLKLKKILLEKNRDHKIEVQNNKMMQPRIVINDHAYFYTNLPDELYSLL